MLGRLSTALTTLHRQAMKSSWSPGPGDVQMMSSLFVKVDCGWEEAAEGTAYQPHRAQARPQSTFTVHKQASAMYRSKVPRWAAARTQTLAKRTSPTHVPLHPSSQPTRKLPPICVIPSLYRTGPGEFIAHFIRNTSSHYNFCDSVSSAPLTRHQVHSICL